ncbi:ROK family protein [Ktedonospora formicarum]|uniref:Xylose repressor protein n=1 Tax=Ktedonospora formicarum TaxID=2778364 RepID=A0A8J3I8T8_9CHLR|nr:ROK family protein [Ktedonospora formicarum]GHO47898.1 xylose repressor protein [Ktedonospora formicarum]
MQIPPIGRHKAREINQNTFLNLIRIHAPISRTQLQKLTGLSQGTTVGLITRLIEQQLVVETGMAASTGGRKAGLLALDPEGGYAVGLSLMEHRVIAALLNLQGEVRQLSHLPLQLRDRGEEAIPLLASCVEDFIQRCAVPRQKIIGLGCGISGPVNTHTGEAIDSWFLNWHSISIRDPLIERLHMPVFVDNAVNCLACYEKLYGRGQRWRDFLIVTLGRGLGLATVVNNALYRGAQGIGAELGHIPISANGRLCECGNRGCLEAYIADNGITETYREMGGELKHLARDQVDEFMIDELYTRARHGDEAAIQTFRQTGFYLGMGLATLVNLYNPTQIMIYGGEGHRVEMMQETILATLKEHTFSLLGRELSLIIEANTTMNNWARGAGSLVLQDFFALTTKS